jgi:hypothetical protein
MAGNGPNEENRCDGVDEGEKHAAVEGGRRPQRRRRPQPEGARKQRPVRHAGIAEEALDPIEESTQPFRIEPRREIAPGEARPQLVIVLPLNRAFLLRPLRQNTEILFIDERSGGNAQAVAQEDHSPQRSFRHEARQPFADCAPGQLIGHVRPPGAAIDHPSFGSAEEDSLISIFSKKSGKEGHAARAPKQSPQSNPARTSTEFECPLMAH